MERKEKDEKKRREEKVAIFNLNRALVLARDLQLLADWARLPWEVIPLMQS